MAARKDGRPACGIEEAGQSGKEARLLPSSQPIVAQLETLNKSVEREEEEKKLQRAEEDETNRAGRRTTPIGEPEPKGANCHRLIASLAL